MLAQALATPSRPGERGFTLLETMIGIAILAALALATASAFGLHGSATHQAALRLQAALVEARSLARTAADDTDPARPTGATVVVAPDPLRPGGSTISVFRSRPIAGPQGPTAAPLPDVGFPPQHVAARFVVTPGLGGSESSFAILLSSSGPASIADPYEYQAQAPALLTSDPGCSDAGVTIAAVAGSSSESHPFACSDGSYDAAVSVASAPGTGS